LGYLLWINLNLELAAPKNSKWSTSGSMISFSFKG
jgi:hypothetical protein